MYSFLRTIKPGQFFILTHFEYITYVLPNRHPIRILRRRFGKLVRLRIEPAF